jgi:hypothetical protein
MPQELLAYITNKLQGVKIMPCTGGCGGKKKTLKVNIVNQRAPSKPDVLHDEDMVLVTYENPNRGQHRVVGANTKIPYGYRQGGGIERFYVHKADIAAHPDWFRPYTPPAVVVEERAIEPPPPPVPLYDPIRIEAPDFIETLPASSGVVEGTLINKPIDLQGIPGVTEKIAEQLNKKGVKNWSDVVNLGVEGLKELEGVGDKRAETILEYARKRSR